MIDISGSILIFAGVGFTALSIIISFANKETGIPIDVRIKNLKGETRMAIRKKGPSKAIKPSVIIYLIAEYIVSKAKSFTFVSFLYLLGASCDLIYIFLEYLFNFNYDLFYTISLCSIVPATFFSTILMFKLVLRIYLLYLFNLVFYGKEY